MRSAVLFLILSSLGCGAETEQRAAPPDRPLRQESLRLETSAFANSPNIAPEPDGGPTPSAVASASASAADEPDVPLGPPPRVTEGCFKPRGEVMDVHPAMSSGDRYSVRSRSYKVFTSAKQVRTLTGKDPPPGVDFTRERVVHIEHDSYVNVQWVVRTDKDIVIGVEYPRTCGGAPPPEEIYDVVVPDTSTPIRVEECYSGGVCSGRPRP